MKDIMDRRYYIDKLMLVGMGGVFCPKIQGRVHIDEEGNRISADGRSVKHNTTEELQEMYIKNLEEKNAAMNKEILRLEKELKGRKLAMLRMSKPSITMSPIQPCGRIITDVKGR